ncbi:MAG: nucleotidyltransferase domain-containing protein [Acidobacteriota bacterium]|nr:nucleotidyltransferase domain-containing protein [Acidobacteriota bacterium]
MHDVTAVVRKFAELAGREFPVLTVFLYGSHAGNTAREGSDIDVGVVIRGSDHDRRLAIAARLCRLGRLVDVRIEPRCIFQDEYEKPKAASILEAIIRQGRRVA